MKIEKLSKGERPTLLEAEKGNELIDHINSLSNTIIVRGGDTDKFIFGKEKTTIQLQEFPTSSSTDLASADESVLITEIDGEPTDLKVLTLNDIKAKDVVLESENESTEVENIDIDGEEPKIDLRSLTLNEIKAKDAIITSEDTSTKIEVKEIDSENPKIDLKTLSLNQIFAEDAVLESKDASILVETKLADANVDLKGLTLNEFKAEDITITIGEGLKITKDVDAKTLHIEMEGSFKDIVVCEDGVQKTYKVRVY